MNRVGLIGLWRQRQHGADIGGNAFHQKRQSVGVGAVHLAEQFIPDRTKIILKCVTA